MELRSNDGRAGVPYNIVPAAVKKLPARTMHFALPLALTFVMTFLVSGVATVRAIGFADDMWSRWIESWLATWVMAFPIMLFLMPVMRRLLLRIIDQK
jgi:hypothetical protein